MTAKKVFNNKAYGNIKGGITAIATSIELYPGQMGAFAENWEDDAEIYLTITNALAEVEIVKVTDIDGDIFTVTRGQDGTVAKEWPAGSVITQRLTAAVVGNFIQKEGYREVGYNPNGVLTGAYVGEKVYQTGQKIWWKNRSGTDWQLIAGTLATYHSWNPIATPGTIFNFAGNPESICWSPDLKMFCAIGTILPSTKVIITSKDGIDWTLQTTPENTNGWNSVCWSPSLGIFVAVALTGTHRVMTSPDGETWTIVDDAVANAGAWRAICWSPDLSLFAAVSGDTSIMVSSDGETWVAKTAPINTLYTSICWSSDLSLFCAAGTWNGSKRPMITSPTGATWTERTPPGSGADDYYSVCWSEDLQLFCAVGLCGVAGNSIMTSANGISWTQRKSDDSIVFEAVCWSSELGLFVAVGHDGGVTGKCYTSVDGIVWISRTITAGQWKAICWASLVGLFVVIGTGLEDSAYDILISDDGGILT